MNKYLMINCDDFGQSRATNQAIMDLLEERKVSSASIMPPAPAFSEAAEWARRRQEAEGVSIGLHLTLTSEIDGLRWKSLTGHPSLHDESGYMHKTVLDFATKAKPSAVKAEIRAQFRAVETAGLNITHVDNHMGSLYGLTAGRSYIPFVLRQCAKRGLPFRLPRHLRSGDPLWKSGTDVGKKLSKWVALADRLGVGLPDHLLSYPYEIEPWENYHSFKTSLITRIRHLSEGVTEIWIHPGVETEKMNWLIPSWPKRVWEYRLMLDEDFTDALREANIHITNDRQVQESAQKSHVKSSEV